MGDAARRLRARHNRRLILRFATAGIALTVWAVIGWALGLSATATMATLCIGMPAVALFQHFVTRERGSHRTAYQVRRRPLRHPVGWVARSRQGGEP